MNRIAPILLLLVLCSCVPVERAPAPPARAPSILRPTLVALIPDRLIVPKIAIDTPVIELDWTTDTNAAGEVFGTWEVADFAAGWHMNSAHMGEAGNMVMSGHNNINGSVFLRLDELGQGDEVEVFSGTQSEVYSVATVMIVPQTYAGAEQQQSNAQWIGPFADERITLVSCWPRDNNTHRIIVVAYPKK